MNSVENIDGYGHLFGYFLFSSSEIDALVENTFHLSLSAVVSVSSMFIVLYNIANV